MGALFLASKLEEAPLRIRDIVNCFSYLDSLVAYCSTPPYPPAATFEAYVPMDYFATEFYDLKDAMVIAEMQILKRLAFQTQCGLPYGHLVNYLQVLELAGEKDLVRRCWGICNDLCVPPFPSSLPPSSSPPSLELCLPLLTTARRPRPLARRLQTAAPALYPQSTLALTSIYLATRLSSPPIALPLEPVPWWTHFDTTEADIVDCADMLLRLYRQWGSDPSGAGAVAAGAGASAGAGAGEGKVGKESVWRRVGRIPVTKAGVRDLLARNGVDTGGETPR